MDFLVVSTAIVLQINVIGFSLAVGYAFGTRRATSREVDV